MKKFLPALLMSLALLAGCTASPAVSPTQKPAPTSAVPTVEESPYAKYKIVATSPGDCEIVYALGETLVGRGELCDYPPEVLDVPVVRSDAEIAALEPDVIITSEAAQTVEQTFDRILEIGGKLGRYDDAIQLVQDMQTQFEIIGGNGKNGSLGDVTVCVEISESRTGGANTFIDELIALCGASNAFGDSDGWIDVTEEEILERAPDYVITEIDPDVISRAGPRLTEAAMQLFVALYGSD
ncbi:hypothetical protein FACS18949_17400 [Clostridia bacterium]|nr:hypothetical protein FACS18949_17400 [Clostridia bacterium]